MGAPLLFIRVEWSEHSPLRGPHEPLVEETGWRHTLAAIDKPTTDAGGSKEEHVKKAVISTSGMKNYGVAGLLEAR